MEGIEGAWEGGCMGGRVHGREIGYMGAREGTAAFQIEG